MDNLAFVTLAASKDSTRYNLTGVFRDKKHLVATDGHRLHYSNGLPEIETGHFLDSRDAQFPDWNQVLPKDDRKTKILWRIDSALINFLNGAKTIGKDFNTISLVINATNEKEKKPISLEVAEGEFNLKFANDEIIEFDGIPFKIAVNVKYLYEVFAFVWKHNKPIPVVEFEYWSELQCVRLTIPQGKAIIMPLRMPKA